jgi:molybdenum cofactor cytidylyltransferase
LRVETLQSLLAFASTHEDRVCQPSYRGRRRHPVLIPKSIFTSLADCQSTNLKDFLQERDHLRALCELDDSGLDIDIDRPDDYERAVRLASDQLTPTL